MGNFKPAVERKNAEPLGDLLKLFVKQNGLETGLYRTAVFNAWDAVCGQPEYVSNKFLRDGILHITVISSVVRNHLMFQLPFILSQVNSIIAEDELLKSMGPVPELKQIKLH